jgi:hypothetical protein
VHFKKSIYYYNVQGRDDWGQGICRTHVSNEKCSQCFGRTTRTALLMRLRRTQEKTVQQKMAVAGTFERLVPSTKLYRVIPQTIVIFAKQSTLQIWDKEIAIEHNFIQLQFRSYGVIIGLTAAQFNMYTS